jgi:PAS domain S-box-containing protein
LWDGETGSFSRDKRYLHKNGEIVWVNLMVSLVREDSGRPRWAVASVQDITERKTMEKALTQSEERCRALSGASFEAVFISEKGVCIEQNATAEKMFGYSSAEAIGRSGTEWIVPEDREMVTNNMLSDYEGRYEVTALRKDGSTFPAEIQARMMQYDGKSIRVTALTDHTEHKQAEKALLESEAKFKTLVTNTEEIVFVISQDGTFLLSEGKGLSKLGLKSGEVVGKSVFELYADYPEMLDAMRRALRGETTTTEAGVAGECFRSWYTPHVNSEGKTVLLGLSVNITEQKQAESKLQEYQEKLRALAAELTLSEERERRRIAEELHDHVGQSLSFARVQLAAAKKATTDSHLAAKLDEISQSLLQAVQDTRDIMYDLSSPSIDEIGLDAAISDWMENRMASRHGLKIEFTADELNTPLDPDTRAILFRNVRELLTNVIKHARAENVSVRMEVERDSLRIVVKDDGVGFDVHGAAQGANREAGFGLFSSAAPSRSNPSPAGGVRPPLSYPIRSGIQEGKCSHESPGSPGGRPYGPSKGTSPPAGRRRGLHRCGRGRRRSGGDRTLPRARAGRCGHGHLHEGPERRRGDPPHRFRGPRHHGRGPLHPLRPALCGGNAGCRRRGVHSQGLRARGSGGGDSYGDAGRDLPQHRHRWDRRFQVQSGPEANIAH